MNSGQRGGTAGSEQSIGELHFGPSDYLAAERTFLAWIRTGIALMGFGFVVARFGLFLEEIQFVQANVPRHSSWLSLFFWDCVDCDRRGGECIFDLGARAIGAGYESRRGLL